MTVDADLNRALQQRIIHTADEYHYIGEDQWSQVVDLSPKNAEDEFEFRRLVRTAVRFYIRAYLVLLLVETDDGQDLGDLLEVVHECEPELSEFLVNNQAEDVLSEESSANLSHVFSIGEALRSALLDRSGALASTLGARFGSTGT